MRHERSEPGQHGGPLWEAPCGQAGPWGLRLLCDVIASSQRDRAARWRDSAKRLDWRLASHRAELGGAKRDWADQSVSLPDSLEIKQAIPKLMPLGILKAELAKNLLVHRDISDSF